MKKPSESVTIIASFKTTASFRNKSKGKNTELSKYILELKNNSINYDLKWSIACKSHTQVVLKNVTYV